MITILLWTIGLATIVASLGILASWVLYAPVVAKAFAEMPWLPSPTATITLDDYPEGVFEAEDVRFCAEDGAHLMGTYLPASAPDRRGVVIFCHELRGNRMTALAFTSGLRAEGFDILAFDFRDHGDSATPSKRRLIPWATSREAADVEAAIDYCCRRDSALAGQIVLFGLSRGASAAMCVAATDSRVRAAVLDSVVFTERVQLFLIRRFMHYHLPYVPQLANVPDVLLLMLIFWANRLIEREDGARILSLGHAARQVRKPVFLVHGGRDSLVPLETVCSLRKQMRNRPKVWVISKARHNDTVHEVGDEYSRRIARFLSRHLTPPAEPAIVRMDAAHAEAARADVSERDAASIAS